MMRYRIGPWAVAALALTLASLTAAATATAPTTGPDTGGEFQPPPPIPTIPDLSPATPPSNPTPAPPPPVSTQPVLPASPNPQASQLGKVLVTSSLDESRDQIAPSLGANTYTVGPQQIQSIPQGDNAPFQQVLLRMPGVVEDSFGQEHVRGEHADVTYRINGVILPEPLNGFGQELDTHLIDSVTLIDGTLPAQFGFRTAGIVDVTTKSGDSLASNELSIYGGSYNTFEPSVVFGGASGRWDYFVTASGRQDSIGIENPDPGHEPVHDNTSQSRLFTYLAYHPDDTSRLSFLINASYADFQIPDTPGVSPSFNLAGAAANPSSSGIDENQNEQQYYGVVSYQKSLDDFSIQASAYTSYGQIHFVPDSTNDLLFQGVAGDVFNNFVTNGIQLDSSYTLDSHHTLRMGLIADYTVERDNTNTWVFATDPATGLQTSDVPINIVDDSRNHATSAGIYLQDEWRLTRNLTFNYGLRYDQFDANFDSEGQLSPRANLVWKMTDALTAHVGYARFFDPPPVQNVGPSTVAKFVNTTNASDNLQADPPRVERSNYYDAGISRQLTPSWLVNLDGYFKEAHNLVDLGQFGQAVILSPFNYTDGYDYGAEISSTYHAHSFSAFGNFAWVETGGRNIDSQQFLIDNAELAYIQNHFIKLDHDSTFTASAGTSWDFTRNDRVSADILYGSGLRSGFANSLQEPYYFPVDVGYQHIFHVGATGRDAVKVRFDVLNLFDQSYQLRSGTGIGVGAPQYGQRRTLLMGIAYDF